MMNLELFGGREISLGKYVFPEKFSIVQVALKSGRLEFEISPVGIPRKGIFELQEQIQQAFPGASVEVCF